MPMTFLDTLFYNSPQSIATYALHDVIMFYLVWITVLVTWFLVQTFFHHRILVRFIYHHTLEFLWTIFPAILLAFIAIPSLTLLYLFDYDKAPEWTVKVIGNQWYWTYEMLDNTYDSYLDNESYPRLWKTDNSLILPTLTPLRLIVSSSDVIHSFAVPNLGIKVDAVPGRLNALHFQILSEGIHYGQCSELCGALHGFMPIEIVSVPLKYLHD